MKYKHDKKTVKKIIMDIIHYNNKITDLKNEINKFIKSVQEIRDEYPSSLEEIADKYGYTKEGIRYILTRFKLPNPYETNRKRINLRDVYDRTINNYREARKGVSEYWEAVEEEANEYFKKAKKETRQLRKKIWEQKRLERIKQAESDKSNKQK